jgi:death on curing protein
MEEPKWLSSSQVRMLHTESLRLFGGSPGLRDEHLLESALAPPHHLYTYETRATLCGFAASYAFGLARNHPFIDGNKRIALLSVRTFLFLNGWRFEPDQVEAVGMMEGLAAGEIDQEMLSEWINAASSPR